MKTIENVLYIISTLFFYPVIAALFFLLGKMCYDTGRFLKELWLRKSHPQKFINVYKAKIHAVFTAEKPAAEILLQEILHQAEQVGHKNIQSARYSIKMGPTLGLVGTLTPMARALASLSTGNMNGLSSQMITAFSTTVIGLVIGGVAFTLMHYYAKWHQADLFLLSKNAEEKLLTLNENQADAIPETH